jgi:hypothetical protein
MSDDFVYFSFYGGLFWEQSELNIAERRKILPAEIEFLVIIKRRARED